VSYGAAHAQSIATDAAPGYPNRPEMSARLAESTIEATPTTPEELAAFIGAETDKWIRVVKDASIEKQ
jgi:tripartite-type tricarboxylate transporter receptor subunit TctC